MHPLESGSGLWKSPLDLVERPEGFRNMVSRAEIGSKRHGNNLHVSISVYCVVKQIAESIKYATWPSLSFL